MKRIAFFFLITVLCSCTVSRNKSIMSDDTARYLKKCSDSINRISITKVVPQFIYFSCLDYQKQYWPNLHQAISLRKLIIEEVDNVESIRYVLNLNDSKIREICDRKANDTIGLNYYNVPLINQSFEQLLKSRLEEL